MRETQRIPNPASHGNEVEKLFLKNLNSFFDSLGILNFLFYEHRPRNTLT